MKIESNILSLPDSFLKEEERCGYRIPLSMKRVWAVQLDILNRVLAICKKHDLKIWMAGGSLLGTIRHKGYIPWDDDLDVMLPREDYRKFCKVAPAELPSDMVLQNQYTEPSFHGYMTRIRKNQTAAIDINEAVEGFVYNMGIYIDIFPLDSFPDSGRVAQVLCSLSFALNKIRRCIHLPSRRFRSLNCTLKKKLIRLFCFPLRFRYLNSIFTRIDDSLFSSDWNRGGNSCVFGSSWWNMCSLGVPDFHRWMYKKKWFKETEQRPFEFLTVPVPANFDEILKTSYGDWREMVQGGACHGDCVFDATQDYKKVLIERFGYIESDFKILRRKKSCVDLA